MVKLSRIVVRKVMLLITSMAAGITLLLMLYMNMVRKENQKNGFNRVLKSVALSNSKQFNLQYNSYYIAGASATRIYLGNVTAPQYLLSIKVSLSDSQFSKISAIENLNLTGVKLRVDSPFIYIKDEVRQDYYIGKLGNSCIKKNELKSDFFTDIVPINSSSKVIRGFDGKKPEYVLSKVLEGSKFLQSAKNLLERQIDGMFCTDGMLLYNKDISRLIYVYFYRNQFLSLDTNLNLLFKGRTIDTNTRVKINVADIKSQHKSTISTPPFMVNRKSCLTSDRLFIESALKADNEERSEFKNNSVIDVYEVNGGTYLFSFYLPKFSGQKVREFRVINKTLIALYDNHLCSYQLNF